MIATLGLVLFLSFCGLFLLMWGAAAYYLIKQGAGWSRVLLLLLIAVAVLSSYFLVYYFLVRKYEVYGLSYLLLLIVPLIVFLRIIQTRYRSRKKPGD
jgi:hypothetical protein